MELLNYRDLTARTQSARFGSVATAMSVGLLAPPLRTCSQTLAAHQIYGPSTFVYF